jgi:peptidoglycan hydrolase-like protein with peptidoglycan-binding domain
MNPRLLAPLLLLLGTGCAHAPDQATFPNSREQLAQALRDRGFLDPNAPKGTQLGGAIRSFQKSQGLAETGWPDKETLSALGIDPATVDSSLDTAQINVEGKTGASPSH